MLKLKTFAAALLAVGALGACSVESVVDDLNNSVIDAAFKAIQDTAKAQGGDAILVRPGKDYTIEITDPNSPINGAKVVVPSAAIPADLEQGAVAIFGAQGVSPASTDGHKLTGPVASVTFSKLPSGEQVEPLANLSITLPYTEAATAPAEQIKLVTINTDGTLLEFEDNTAAGAKVTGGAKKYNVFAPFWAVDYDGTSAAPEGSLIFKVTNGDKSCAGLVENVADRLVEHKYANDDVAGGFVFSLTEAGLTTFAIVNTADKDATPSARPVDPATVSPTLANSGDTISFTCTAADGSVLGGTVQTDNGTSVTLSNYVDAGPGTPSLTCASGTCTKYDGAVDIDATWDFTASDGSVVKAKMATSVPSFEWWE